MKRCVIALLTVLLCLLCVGALADATTIPVANEAELQAAVATINSASSGEFVISLTGDITVTGGSLDFKSNATKTILGNGHTLTASSPSNYVDSFIVLWNGTLNLGKMNGDGSAENKLLITQASGVSGADSSSCIQVIANKINGAGGYHPILNMHDGVTISNWKTNNTYGAAIRLYSDELETGLTATFNMYGGAISNCEITGGSTKQGGGVAVMHNGVFNMSGGSITGCKVSGSGATGGGVCLTYTDPTAWNVLDGIVTVDEPVFTMTGGEISGNTAHQGGGVSVLNGTFNMKGGMISNNNTASHGGGIVVWGGYYGYLPYSGKVTISGGIITHNFSTSFGGGIAALYTAPVTMTGGILCNNKSTQRGDDLSAIYSGENIRLSSATAMGQKYESFQREGSINTWTKTRFVIDGWYVDGDNSGASRWSYDSALRIGDTAQVDNDSVSNYYVKAAYTPYDEIEITKTWKDGNNQLGQRPESLTFTLIDNNTNQPVTLRTLDGTTGAEATVTLTAADKTDDNTWKGTIWPLAIANYTSGFSLEESDAGDFYQLENGTPTIDYVPDVTGGTAGTDPGVYTTSFTNTARIPVSIHKIWDDANNADGVRPDALNVELRMNNQRLKLIDGTTEAFFTLTPSNSWSAKAYLALDDYSEMSASEGDVSGRGYTKSSYITENDDHSYTVVFVNRHVLKPVQANAVSNGNMTEIEYQVTKTWDGINPVGGKQLPRPEITVILYKDNQEFQRKTIPADTADPATVTFTGLPKYKDNNGDELANYTIKEIITDKNWVRVGSEWYSLDGMGKYGEPTIGPATNTETKIENTIANHYANLQPSIDVSVTKLWKDHGNESGVRPNKITLGLFTPDGNTLVKTTELSSVSTENEWTGFIAGLAVYDDNGNPIDYSKYIIKESYDDGINWIENGESHTISVNGKDYIYEYSVESSASQP